MCLQMIPTRNNGNPVSVICIHAYIHTLTCHRHHSPVHPLVNIPSHRLSHSPKAPFPLETDRPSHHGLDGDSSETDS